MLLKLRRIEECPHLNGQWGTEKVYVIIYDLVNEIDRIIEKKEEIERSERDLIVNATNETIEELFLDKEGQIDNGEEETVVAVLKEDTEREIEEIIME